MSKTLEDAVISLVRAAGDVLHAFADQLEEEKEEKVPTGTGRRVRRMR